MESDLPNRMDLENRLNRLWAEQPPFAQPLAAGQVMGNYRIRAPLGAGAFGVVYLADDVRDQRPVALKIPRPEVLLDTDRLQRFTDEAAAIAKLDHPGIVKLYESETSTATPFIAFQWCDGPNLEQWLAQRRESEAGPMDWTEATKAVIKMADALSYVHQQGITHRDLKPANILLDRFSDDQKASPKDTEHHDSLSLSAFTLRISDFGLSKWLGGDHTQTRSSLIVGTPVYMAPEQLMAVHQDVAPTHSNLIVADIYSLGAILFEMLSGQPPVQGEHYLEILSNIRHRRFNQLRKLRPDLPKGIYTVVSSCLHSNPEARYQSVEELASDLKRVVAGRAATGRSISISKRYRFWHNRETWMETAGRFAIVSGGLIAIWLVVTSLAAFAHGVIPAASAGSVTRQLVTLIVTSTTPLVLLGWLCIKKHRWAALLGAIFNIGNLIAAVSGMLGRPLAFEELYFAHDIYFCFTIHLFIFLCYASLQLLFVFAMLSNDARR